MSYSGVLCTNGGMDDLPCESEEVACMRVCQGGLTSFEHLATCGFEADKKTVTCNTFGMPCGRAHEGLAPAARREHASPIARWLEEAAYLEDASVTSFEILTRELETHDAPEHLVRAARRSARDEARHTRVMSALAQRHGGRPQRADRAARARAPRTLEAMLLENAVEGCVNETYGALLAWYQSEHASDPKVRAALKQIAPDETRHAALAWRIAAWAEPRLDAATRARIRAARAHAFAELDARLAVDPSPEAGSTIGLPSAHVARSMLQSLVDGLPLAA